MALCGRAGRCWRCLSHRCGDLTLSLLHDRAGCLHCPPWPAQFQPPACLHTQPGTPATQFARGGEPREVSTPQGLQEGLHIAGSPSAFAHHGDPIEVCTSWAPWHDPHVVGSLQVLSLASPFVSELGEGRSCCPVSSTSHQTKSNGGCVLWGSCRRISPALGTGSAATRLTAAAGAGRGGGGRAVCPCSAQGTARQSWSKGHHCCKREQQSGIHPGEGPGGGGFSWRGPRQDNSRPGGGRELPAVSAPAGSSSPRSPSSSRLIYSERGARREVCPGLGAV